MRVTLGGRREYAIVFTLKKTRPSICEMFVMSAYALDRPKHQVIATGEMKFNVPVALALAGKNSRRAGSKTQKEPEGSFCSSCNLLVISPCAWTLAGGGCCRSQSGNPMPLYRRESAKKRGKRETEMGLSARPTFD